MQETHHKSGFSSLFVSTRLCQVLSSHHWVEPTPIQAAAIPVAMAHKDVIGIAQTGTGKTLAFGLPMAELLRKNEIGLVLAPTRELAHQIQETLTKLELKTVLLVGGTPMGPQLYQLRQGFQVIVATPGRLMDHLQRGSVHLRHAKIVVLDEADRMLDMGFSASIRRILGFAPKARQTMLFSATMPPEIVELASEFLKDPMRVEVAAPGTASELIDQELMYVTKEGKREAIEDLLGSTKGSVLIFSRTRHGARKLARDLRHDGHHVTELHSDRTLPQRRAALEGFKNGSFRIMVATDIASRGIDVKGISLVLNSDLPDQPDDYVHRIGRTGRAGAAGRAVTLAFADQARDVRDIEALIGMTIPISDKSTVEPDMVSHRAPLRKAVKKALRERGEPIPGERRPKNRIRAEKPAESAPQPEGRERWERRERPERRRPEPEAPRHTAEPREKKGPKPSFPKNGPTSKPKSQPKAKHPTVHGKGAAPKPKAGKFKPNTPRKFRKAR